jgi:hypothetical protein
MSSRRPRESPDRNFGGPLGLFRALALIAVTTGAAASIGLMLLAGSRQRSLVLIGLFVGWVLSPFAAAAWAGVVSGGWPSFTRATLYCLMFLLTLVSLAMYDGILPMPSGSRPAAVFLIVPLGSWVLIAIAAFAGRRWMRATGTK